MFSDAPVPQLLQTCLAFLMGRSIWCPQCKGLLLCLIDLPGVARNATRASICIGFKQCAETSFTVQTSDAKLGHAVFQVSAILCVPLPGAALSCLLQRHIVHPTMHENFFGAGTPEAALQQNASSLAGIMPLFILGCNPAGRVRVLGSASLLTPPTQVRRDYQSKPEGAH